MTKTINRAAAIGLVLLAATACSSTPGTPPASTAPPSSTGPQVPQVANPLNVGKYEQDPCAALTQAQATEVFGAVRNRKAPGNVAPACAWNDSDNSSIHLGFLPGQGGLQTVYKNSIDAGGGYFEPSPAISDHPAAFSGVHDDRQSGGCQVFVGVTNEETFSVSSNLRPSSSSYRDPCALVTKVAEAALATIKAGA
ncbi:DUF3558 domain-containing protein [Amycolatopsis jejuensis]|uniref:DUF3558 domain-containing protein n=1 Tax=Amycolatopsis jejuensis TaxID=330084 RepID=UPI0005247F3D|nr:DUF3558 domain-containing protein [Amycolatopsis jejuensis]